MQQSPNSSKVTNPYLQRKDKGSSGNNGGTGSRNQRIQSQPSQKSTRNGTSFAEVFKDVNTSFLTETTTTAKDDNSKKRNANEMTSQRNASSATVTAGAPNDQAGLIQPHVLLVSTKQKGNDLIRFLRNVPYTYTKIVPDYIMGPNRCALFLSFKYHNLHPHYVHRRIAELKNDFDLRVLLCLVDVEDNAAILATLNKLCTVNSLSLILTWSSLECARYLESFKVYENKDTSSIQKKKDLAPQEQIADVLSSVRSVNKTDSSQLLMQFGSLKSLVTASVEELHAVPGIGDKKVKRLFAAFNEPFSKALARKRKEAKENEESIERDIVAADDIDFEVIEESIDRKSVENRDVEHKITSTFDENIVNHKTKGA